MAIEVKHSVHIRKEDLAGLKSFAEDYPTAECFFLYKGKTIENTEIFNASQLNFFYST